MNLKTSIKLPLLFLFCCIFQTLSFGQELPARPNPPRLVNDFAGALSAQENQALESKLNNYNDSTSTQIAVVIMRSTGEYEIKDYAQRLAQDWGIGTKEKNNGVILLVAIDDRKMAIQTGYGMEGSITDAGTKRIIENEIKPYFKQQQYYSGIDAGVDALFLLAKGEYKADQVKGKKAIPKSFIIFIIIIVIFFIINSFKNKGKGGGGRGRYTSGGFLEGALLGSMLSNRGSGSSWGGGGGGFGGFGGGGFGGGGSSGSW